MLVLSEGNWILALEMILFFIQHFRVFHIFEQ